MFIQCLEVVEVLESSLADSLESVIAEVKRCEVMVTWQAISNPVGILIWLLLRCLSFPVGTVGGSKNVR